MDSQKKAAQWNFQPIAGVKKVIAVASGKGGVGKSTVCYSLARTLADSGKKVGILDADIYGPSIAHMMGITSRPPVEGEKIQPPIAGGITVMSMGFMIPEGQPLIWRGPMITKTINQFLRYVNWGELDTLLVDMPPGTGDVQLSMIQQIPLDGAIIVTTPHELSLIDVRRCVEMFRKLGVPLTGVIENMSYFEDSSGNKNYLFGEGGGEKIAKEYCTSLLASIPVQQNSLNYLSGLEGVI